MTNKHLLIALEQVEILNKKVKELEETNRKLAEKYEKTKHNSKYPSTDKVRSTAQLGKLLLESTEAYKKFSERNLHESEIS